MLLLLVEDDDSLAQPLSAGLARHGFEIQRVQSGSEALAALGGRPDLILLDMTLPDMDGLEVCRQIRRTNDVPIIFLTSRGDETDRVVGLEIGADDYVVKPFSLRELAARIRAVSRRRAPAAPILHSTRLEIDRDRRRVVLDGDDVELTAKEFDLLVVLAETPGRVVPRQELWSRVWDPVWVGSGKTLDVHIASLRKKLGDAQLIETMRGVGYRLADSAA